MKKPPKGIGLYIRRLRSGEQKYESRLWNPYLKQLGKTKLWDEKDLDKVIELHQQLKQSYKSSDYEIIRSEEKKNTNPQMILECAALYEQYLRDDPEVVPPHKAKHRSEKHIKEAVKYIRSFLVCLKENGYKLSHTHINAVNDDAVGLFYDHLEQRFNKGEIGEVSYNRPIIRCRSWINTLISYFDYELENAFENVTRKTEVSLSLIHISEPTRPY